MSTALKALQDGEIVLLVSDTLVGLHCRADRPGARRALAELKQAPDNSRPFLLLFDSSDAVFAETLPTPDQARTLRQLWPGPLTAVLRPRSGVPVDWFDGDRAGGLAARVPAPAALRALISSVGAPLYSTSANISGGAPSVSLEEARQLFGGLAYDSLGLLPSQQASTLVDLTQNEVNIVRSGPLAWPEAGRS